MRILLLGSGGREHALAWKIAQSVKCSKLFIAPGNAGTGAVGENVAIGVNDFDKLKDFVVEEKVDMVVVGPEDPLVNGVLLTALGMTAAQLIFLLLVLQRLVLYSKGLRILPKLS